MKKKLLLLHSALGTSKQFDQLIPLLENHFDVMIPDLPGHAGNPIPEKGFHIDDFADAVIDCCEKSINTKWLVFGYSMGGYAALSAALKRPQLFEGIMTLGTKFDWTPETAQREMSMLDPDKILAKVPFFAEELKRLHDPNDWTEMLKHTADMMAELGIRPSISASAIQSLDVPIHLMIGAQDSTAGVEYTRQFAESIPHAKLTILDGLPHPINRVPPSLLAEMIVDEWS